MFAFHVNWTRPFTARNPGAPYAVEPFELLTTVLSALEWQRQGGVIAMATDGLGAAYYEGLGLGSLWNGGIRPVLQDAIPDTVSPFAFWAAGKLYALREMPAPCVMIDTDFILWRSIEGQCAGADAAAIHREEIYPDIYPGPSHFQVAEGFDMDGLDWSVQPCNTALAYFGSAAFKGLYTARAISFMDHAPHADDPLTYMVFAEQRLLAMCAAEAGAKLAILSDLDTLFGSGQQAYTHVWGYKQQMRDDPAAYIAFCRRCAARIKREYPGFAPAAAAVPCLSQYF